jgi:hypothetical protein
MKIEEHNNFHNPDTEEISDALNFLHRCSKSDLLNSWVEISKDWNNTSIIQVHKTLCSTGRINDLLEAVEEANPDLSPGE